MPKPTKRDQLAEVQKLLGEAAYKLSHEVHDWDGGYKALQLARAMVADLNGQIDVARAARKYVEHMETLVKAHFPS